jgi:demethylmenaquinone methyltransferase / 2-methoxy-6-polyprenyl-1,4-benzoquinol methylase
MANTERGPTAPPARQVEAMFDSIVGHYDLLNGILSFGLDRRWRRLTVEAVHPGFGARILDLGCGTGDLTTRVAEAGARPVGVDLSHRMLAEASRKLGPGTPLVRGSAFELPFVDGSFQGAVSGFVLRNLAELPRAFAELARVVEPTGRIALMDITEPPNRLARRAFDAYFRLAAPALGALVGKRDAYRYLVRSLGHLPPPPEVCRLLAEAGFDQPAARPLTGGTVTLFTGTRR